MSFATEVKEHRGGGGVHAGPYEQEQEFQPLDFHVRSVSQGHM
jgi:hypothetical protein